MLSSFLLLIVETKNVKRKKLKHTRMLRSLLLSIVGTNVEKNLRLPEYKVISLLAIVGTKKTYLYPSSKSSLLAILEKKEKRKNYPNRNSLITLNSRNKKKEYKYKNHPKTKFLTLLNCRTKDIKTN